MMVCIRMPKRLSRPCSAASLRIHSTFSATAAGRLAPGQVDVGVPGGHRAGGGRGPAEVDLRHRVGDLAEARRPRPGGARPSKSTVSPAHSRRTIVEELVAAGVAGVLVEEVAEHPLLVALAAGDDVEQQPAARSGSGRSPAIWAARNGEIRPGRNATRNFSRSETWLSIAVEARRPRTRRRSGSARPRSRCPPRPGRSGPGRPRDAGRPTRRRSRRGRRRRRDGRRRRWWAGTSGTSASR